MKGQSRMDNPEKLATLGTQDTRGRQTKQKNTTQYMLETSTHKTQNEDKQNKNTTQHNMCWTPLYTNKHK